MALWKKKKVYAQVFQDGQIKATRKRKTVMAKISDSLQVVPSNYQHIGARENQEDSFVISDFSNSQAVEVNGVLALVADGMGGLAFGEEASRTAAEAFLKIYEERSADEAIRDSLKRALLNANTAVFDLALNGDVEHDLGTTLVASVIYGDELHWISAGDSRIYLYREDDLQQLNTDHTYANYLEDDVANGKLTRQEALEHPERDYLTSYLGLPELKEISLNEKPLKLKAKDKILLCSDGLTNTLPAKRIAELLKSGVTKVAEEVTRAVLMANKPYQDNVTVVVLSVLSLQEDS